MTRRGQLWEASPELLERRARAVELKQAGLTIREIGKALGVSHQTAHTAVINGLRMIVGDATIEMERQTDVARLDTMIRSMWPDVLNGDKDAVRETLACLKRRAQLLGLDAPKTVRVEQVPVDAIEAEIQRLAAQLADNDRVPQPPGH